MRGAGSQGGLGIRSPFPDTTPDPGPGPGTRRAAGARGSYSAARASAAQPSGGILRVTNTFMSLTGLIHLAAAGH